MKVFCILLFTFSAAIAFAAPLPEAGSSQQQVLKLLGEPDTKKAPVDQPAINRWVYLDFTVYFEQQRVIHSVKH